MGINNNTNNVYNIQIHINNANKERGTKMICKYCGKKEKKIENTIYTIIDAMFIPASIIAMTPILPFDKKRNVCSKCEKAIERVEKERNKRIKKALERIRRKEEEMKKKEQEKVRKNREEYFWEKTK